MSLELPKINHTFWARYRRRQKAERAWRRYVLQQRLAALRRANPIIDDWDWDRKIGRYL